MQSVIIKTFLSEDIQFEVQEVLVTTEISQFESGK